MSMARAVEQAVNELSPVCLRLGAFSAVVDGMNQCGSPCSAGAKRGELAEFTSNTESRMPRQWGNVMAECTAAVARR